MGTGSVDIILGVQWGDEGKGRVVDAYAASGYDVVARFGGGNNAGHSIHVGDRHLALHLIPSGVLIDGVDLFIGGGTVIDLAGLVRELDALEAIGFDARRLKIADTAHLVLPYHRLVDRITERARGDRAIGTTGRGIGPAYIDRVARCGVPIGLIRDVPRFTAAVTMAYARYESLLHDEEDEASCQAMIDEVLALRERFVPLIVDGVSYIHRRLEEGARLLVEGAQGTLLDIGYGTYPYVTSSVTIAGGACAGLGIGPRVIDRVLGVAKAYCTRVGAGPFPSELLDERGEDLRTRGKEFGVTTGRARRCGWFDAVAGRYAVRLNGLTGLILTKLDVLSGLERIGVVTGYRLNGQDVGFEAIEHPALESVVTWFEGWHEPIGKVRRIVDLPRAARTYLEYLSQTLHVPIVEVSVGPERSESAR